VCVCVCACARASMHLAAAIKAVCIGEQAKLARAPWELNGIEDIHCLHTHTHTHTRTHTHAHTHTRTHTHTHTHTHEKEGGHRGQNTRRVRTRRERGRCRQGPRVRTGLITGVGSLYGIRGVRGEKLHRGAAVPSFAYALSVRRSCPACRLAAAEWNAADSGREQQRRRSEDQQAARCSTIPGTPCVHRQVLSRAEGAGKTSG